MTRLAGSASRRFGVSRRRHPVAWALALAAAITLPSLLFLAPQFGTPDDVGMTALADGSYYQERQPHMVFSNVALGLLLSTLYGWAGSVPWYGIYLAAVHFATLAVVIYLVVSEDRWRPRAQIPALAAYLAVFGLWLATHLAFTSQGLMLASAGTVLYLARGHRRSAVVVAAVMAGSSTLIRWDSLWGALALAAPFLILAFRRLPHRNQALFAGITAGIVLLGSGFQAAYYAGDAEWADYFTFNRVRGGLMEQSDWARDEGLLAAVGWSRNDAAMFAGHFYLDEEVFSVADLEQIAREVDSVRPLGDSLAGSFRSQTDSPVEIAGWALVAVLMVAAATSRSRGARLLAVAVPSWSVAVAAALVMFRKLPDRVSVPVIAFAALMLLVLPQVPAPGTPPHRERPGRRVLAASTALLAVALAAAGTLDAAAGVGTRRRADQQVTRALRAFEALDPEGIFLSWGARLGLGSLSPWHAPVLAGPRLIPLGWAQRSPMQAEWLEALGIDDLYTAVADRDDVYLPLPSRETGRIYLRYLEEHYGFAGLLRPAGRVADYTIYDLAAGYELSADGGQLTELRFDGTAVPYPLDDQGIKGRATQTSPPGRGTALTGSVTALDGAAPVDLVVLTSGRRGIALTLPGPVAGSSTDPGWFSMTLTRRFEDLGLIALFRGTGASLPLGPAPGGPG